jgi:VanZ family protein
VLWWVTTVVWTVVIFILSTRAFGLVWSTNVLWKILTHLSLPVSPRTLLDINLFIRKLAHVFEYAILASLLYRLVRPPAQNGWHSRSGLLSILGGALYAASDELHQLFVPGRRGTVRDWALDVAGVTLGTLVTYFLVRFSPAKSKRNAASSESTEAK